MQVQGRLMKAKQIEELKKRHKETQFLQVDCALASIDLNSLRHLRALVWHVFNSLRVQTPSLSIATNPFICGTSIFLKNSQWKWLWSKQEPFGRSSSRILALIQRWWSCTHTLAQHGIRWLTIANGNPNNKPWKASLVLCTKHLALFLGAQYCEESRVYNCDSRSGELEKVLAAHNVSQLTSVYLVTDLRHPLTQS